MAKTMSDENMNIRNDSGGTVVDYTVDDDPTGKKQGDLPRIHFCKLPRGKVVSLRFPGPYSGRLYHKLNGETCKSTSEVPALVRICDRKLKFDDVYIGKPDIVIRVSESASPPDSPAEIHFSIG